MDADLKCLFFVGHVLVAWDHYLVVRVASRVRWSDIAEKVIAYCCSIDKPVVTGATRQTALEARERC